MKKRIRKIFSAVIILLLVIFSINYLSPQIYASTPDAYMIVANPGEDSSIEMNIGWHTDVSNIQSYVIYTTKDDIEWKNAEKVMGTYEYVDVFNGIYSKSAKGEDIYEDAIFLDYNALLTNLTPDTEYMYKVGQNTLSEIQYFKTAGNTTFSFAWISDFHTYDPLPARLTNAMNMIKTLDEYNNGFDFIFSTGDEMAWGGSYSHWLDLFEKDYHKNYMWASVIGNHDYMDRTSTKSCNDFFKSVYSFPTNGYIGEEGVCYYFKYSNVLFITMNNETQTSATEIKKAQDWFEEVVTKNPAQYIVVAQHYQWFNGINGKSNSSGYDRWKELFDKYQVDLAISGNNHIYVRSELLYNDKVSKDYNYGTTYIQASSSDNERGQDMSDLTYNSNLIAHRFTEGGKTVSGIVVNVTEEEMKIELLDRNGNLEDSVSIQARRDVYPMNNFSKEYFESSIKIINTVYDDTNVIKFSNDGIGYIEKIEILKDDAIINESNFRKALDTFITINDLSVDSVSDLKVKITYKDKTMSVIDIKLSTKKINGKLSNFNVKITDEGYKVTFDNTYQNLDKIYVYLNNEIISEEKGTINEINIINETQSFFDKIKIVCVSDEVEVFSKELNYYSSVDLNCDGLENEEDIIYLQEMICNEITEEDQLYYYLDINNDGVVDIEDATYLSMYINKKISNPVKKQFTIQFIDIDGKIIEVQVAENETYEMNDLQYAGYTFVGWDKDYSNITDDIIVYAIYIKDMGE